MRIVFRRAVAKITEKVDDSNLDGKELARSWQRVGKELARSSAWTLMC